MAALSNTTDSTVTGQNFDLMYLKDYELFYRGFSITIATGLPTQSQHLIAEEGVKKKNIQNIAPKKSPHLNKSLENSTGRGMTGRRPGDDTRTCLLNRFKCIYMHHYLSRASIKHTENFRRIKEHQGERNFNSFHMYPYRVSAIERNFRDGMAHLSFPFKALITHGNCPLTCLSFPSS